MKKYKFLFFSLLLVLFNLIFKGFNFNKVPNSLSIEEINIINSLPFHFTNYSYDYIYRLIPIVFSTLISLTIYLMFRKITSNYLISFLVGLSLVFSPWIFILSRYINYYIIFTLLIIFINYILISSKFRQLFNLFGILLMVVFIDQKLNIEYIYDNWLNLLQVIDFRNIFFVGDLNSTYIHIPKTGFFMFIEIILFFSGVYYLFTKSNDSIKSILITFILNEIIIFFLTSPSLITTYKIIFLLLSINIIIGLGLYYLLISLILKQKKILLGTVVVLMIFNIFYYQELFYNHFDKKNSTEWGYAEENLAKFIISHPTIKNIYITNGYSRIIKYFSLYFSNIPNYSIKEINDLKLLDNKICSSTVNICVLREQDVINLSIDKDNIKNRIIYANGLPAYYLLYNNL